MSKNKSVAKAPPLKPEFQKLLEPETAGTIQVLPPGEILTVCPCWEYRTAFYHTITGPESDPGKNQRMLDDGLRLHGERGWELVGIQTITTGVRCFFKRALLPPGPRPERPTEQSKAT